MLPGRVQNSYINLLCRGWRTLRFRENSDSMSLHMDFANLGNLTRDSSPPPAPTPPDEREVVQKKTFTKWVNSHLARVSCRITDLYKDLRDGRMLIKLLEVLSGEMLVKLLSVLWSLSLCPGHHTSSGKMVCRCLQFAWPSEVSPYSFGRF